MTGLRLAAVLILLITVSLAPGGCLKEYADIYITNVDVMSAPQEEGTRLTVTPYIQNNQNTDSDMLSVRVKIMDPDTNLIVAEAETEAGYIKSKSQVHNSVFLTVKDSGEYIIIVQVFSEGKLLNERHTPVTVRGKTGPAEPADIKLIDTTLEIKQYVDSQSKVVLDVSPAIYNQGGDSGPLTMSVTARVNQYTAYTETDELGIVAASGRVRGNVQFILPKNQEYSFSVQVEENGKTVSSSVKDKIKLSTLKINSPVTYVLVEEGKPISTPTETPGFQAIAVVLCIMLLLILLHRNRGDTGE